MIEIRYLAVSLVVFGLRIADQPAGFHACDTRCIQFGFDIGKKKDGPWWKAWVAGGFINRLSGQLRQTQENLDAMRGLKKGLLKLGAVSTTKYFAPSLLSAFTEEHPDVTVRFSVGNREQGSGTRASMEKPFSGNDLVFHASMEASSNETIKQAVMAGMGISLLSSHTVGLELKTGLLAMLDVAGLPIMRDWFVMHLQTKRLSPVAAAFRQFLLDHGSRIIGAAANYDVPARPRS